MHMQQNRNIVAALFHRFAQFFLSFHSFRPKPSMRCPQWFFPEKQKPDRRQIDGPVRVEIRSYRL